MTTPQQEAVIAAAVGYAGLGWSVIPLNRYRKPLGRWTKRHTQVMSPERVEQRFRRLTRLAGVGLVLGDVSGCLCVRDFDDAVAYKRWAASFPVHAASLTTVRTVRGFHVYFRWQGIATRKMGDGELRGAKVYVALPPSPHELDPGFRYAWPESGPPSEGSWIDPAEAGLDQCWKPNIVDRANERTERNERMEETQEIEETEETQEIEAIGSGWFSQNAELLLAIIRRTIPTAIGTRNAGTFRFARALKAIPALAAIPESKIGVLKPLVRQWFDMAGENIGTRDFAETWGDFVHGWTRVRLPEGSDALSQAMERAESLPPPEWSADYAPKCRLLASLCRELQRTAGQEVFFLGIARAGQCVGVDKVTAWRWLKAFVADGILDCVEVGNQTRARASRFRYIAPDL